MGGGGRVLESHGSVCVCVRTRNESVGRGEIGITWECVCEN